LVLLTIDVKAPSFFLAPKAASIGSAGWSSAADLLVDGPGTARFEATDEGFTPTPPTLAFG